MNLPEPALIEPDWPLPAGVRAVQTTRHGGFSTGAWSSLNLGLHTGDDPARVRANQQHLAAVLGLSGRLRWPRQVHGTEVCAVAALSAETCADAVVAQRAGEVCAVQTADCLPVLFCTRDGSQVAAAHAGWRGLAAGVLEATLQQLDAAPADVLVWLGPAIGPQAFEVGPEVQAAFTAQQPAAAAAFVPGRGDRFFADIYQLARLRLAVCGVAAIYGGEYCTYTESDTFFSYRRNSECGRMTTLIWRQA